MSDLLQLHGIPSRLVGNLLLLGNRQSVDSEIVADAGDNKNSPAEVHDQREDEVCVEVVELELGADLRKTNSGKVSEDRTTDKRHQHDGPHGEGLVRQVSEDHLGGETTKDKGKSEAEEKQMVLLHQSAVRRENPKGNGNGENGHGSPLKEDGRNRETILATGSDNVGNAKGNLRKDQRSDNDADPDVPESSLAENNGQAGGVVSQKVVHGLGPDTGAVDS